MIINLVYDAQALAAPASQVFVGAWLGESFLAGGSSFAGFSNIDVAELSNGNAVASWNNGANIKFEILSADSAGEFPITPPVAVGGGDGARHAQVAPLTNGNFVVNWYSPGNNVSGPGEIDAQIYDPFGNPIGQKIVVFQGLSSSSAVTNVETSAITPLANGGFIINYSTAHNDLILQTIDWNLQETVAVYNANGNLQKSTLEIGSRISNSEAPIVVRSLDFSNGNFVEFRPDQSGQYHTFLESDTLPSGAGFLSPVIDPGSSSYALAKFSDGKFVATWNTPDPTTNASQIKYQIFDQNAASVSVILKPTENANVAASNPDVAVTSDNHFVITWNQASGSGFVVKAQVFDADGSQEGSAFTVNPADVGSDLTPSVAALPDNGFVITYDNHPDRLSSITFLKSQAFYLVNGVVLDDPQGDNTNNDLAGTQNDDVIKGLGGSDHILGLGGADHIDGGAGNDTINGGPKKDTLNGGPGADRFVFDFAALSDAHSQIFDVVTDYDSGNNKTFSSAEGDQIDLSAILASAYNHGSGQAVSTLVRAIEDSTGTFATLQIDPDGAANGTSWTTIAKLDGLHVGNAINIILDSSLPGGSSINVRALATLNDFNGDGTSDILWRNDSSGHVGIWEMHNGVNTWHDLGGSGVDHKVVGIGDYNGDGTPDLFWRNDSSGHVGWWEMHNDVPTWHDIGGSGVDHKVVGVGDFNGDGTSDLFWRNDSSGHTGIWEMHNGVPTWHDLGGSGVDHKVVGVGDFNGDGTSDILWRNDSTGHVGIWDMHDNVPTWIDLGGSGVDHKVVGVGDFNGDGTSDLFWRNDSTGHVGIWEMHNNVPTWIDLGFISGIDHKVVSVGDFNGDGTSDLFWRNDSTGHTGIWEMHNDIPTWHDLGGSGTDHLIIT